MNMTQGINAFYLFERLLMGDNILNWNSFTVPLKSFKAFNA